MLFVIKCLFFNSSCWLYIIIFPDRKPPGVGRGRGRGRDESSGGRPAKGIGRGLDDGIAKGAGRGRGGSGGKPGGKGKNFLAVPSTFFPRGTLYSDFF